MGCFTPGTLHRELKGSFFQFNSCQGFHECISMIGSLVACHKLTLRAVEIVIFIAWRDMVVIMPDILVASRFVVLPSRNAIAGVNHFHSDRQTFSDSMNVVRFVSFVSFVVHYFMVFAVKGLRPI